MAENGWDHVKEEKWSTNKESKSLKEGVATHTTSWGLL